MFAYFSLSGNTEKMTEYIAEGVVLAGTQTVVRKISDIKNFKDSNGYDGHIFGSLTYYRDMTKPMKLSSS